MPDKTIVLKHLFHRGQNCIGLYFPRDKILEAIVKLTGAQWSQTHRCWYLRNHPQNLKNLFASAKGKAWIDQGQFFREKGKKNSAIRKPAGNKVQPRQHKVKKKIPEDYEMLMRRRRYSPNTIKAYTSLFQEFISYFPDKPPQHLNEMDIRKYQDYLVKEKKVSTSTQNQSINAIKFYYEQILKQEKKSYWIERPKKEQTLPSVLSKRQVKTLISSPDNLKHRSMLTLIYSAGLRSGELINLKIADVNSNRMLIHIRGAKGRKDRYTILSKNSLYLLRQYFKQYTPRHWLYEGAKGKKYSSASLRAVF